ncbi:outer membrane beta-barrel protein [Pontibacter cellulosilyticus]|uniref:Outer membrane beta-barrel protein n=1 Tax=Pontibacter cellulosilyticus TaxID=1720253 RepID=A0A923N9S3_9BACT|nr:outer membrane beta-barrel protein [Pontibacter cellulosilyticus]MBC5994881.1 outer membrane beta-barrel protein [Pontibacter cellulosilyticus]
MKASIPFIIIFLLFLSATNILAQESTAEEVEIEEDLPKLAIEKAVVLGASYTHIKFGNIRSVDEFSDSDYFGYGSDDFEESTDITGGLMFNLSSPRFSKKLKIATGLFINSYRTKAGFEDYFTNPNSGASSEIVVMNKISAVYVAVPLMLQIDFPVKTFIPYFKAGPGLSILAYVDHNRYAWHDDMNDNRVNQYNYDPENKSIAKSISGALGVRFPVTSKNNGVIEFSYQINDGLAPREHAHQTNQIISGVVGVSF